MIIICNSIFDLNLQAWPAYIYATVQDANNYYVTSSIASYQSFGFNKHNEIVGKTHAEAPSNIAEHAVCWNGQNERTIKALAAKYFMTEAVFNNKIHCNLACIKVPVFNIKKQILGVFALAKKMPINSDLHESIHLLQSHFGNSLKKHAWDINTTYSKLLTSKESKVLFYVLTGKSSKKIAEILFLSPKTVEFHIQNIKIKLGLKNTTKADLFDKAYELGFVNILPIL